MTVVKMVKAERLMISSGTRAHELVFEANIHFTLKFVVLFMFLLNKYFLSTFYMWNTVLITRNVVTISLPSKSLHASGEETNNKQTAYVLRVIRVIKQKKKSRVRRQRISGGMVCVPIYSLDTESKKDLSAHVIIWPETWSEASSHTNICRKNIAGRGNS